MIVGSIKENLSLEKRVSITPETAKNLIKKAFTKYKLPYISLTPTFSICNDHGYISGEHFNCPTCNKPAEVYTRVVGYLRPVQNFNKGKKAEYKDRVKYVIKESQEILGDKKA